MHSCLMISLFCISGPSLPGIPGADDLPGTEGPPEIPETTGGGGVVIGITGPQQPGTIPPESIGDLIETLLFPEAEALEMKIGEGIGDYARAIADVQARSTETAAEAARRIGVTETEAARRIGVAKGEGILSLKEQGAQAAHEGRMAMTGAEMVASSEEARLGMSGVRAKGSPLLAAQQNVDLAFAAADRTIERGRAGMAIGGLRLETGLAGIGAARDIAVGDIGAQSSLLTSEYKRRMEELTFKKTELETNAEKMLRLAKIGGISDWASTFYKVGTTIGGFF